MFHNNLLSRRGLRGDAGRISAFSRRDDRTCYPAKPSCARLSLLQLCLFILNLIQIPNLTISPHLCTAYINPHQSHVFLHHEKKSCLLILSTMVPPVKPLNLSGGQWYVSTRMRVLISSFAHYFIAFPLL